MIKYILFIILLATFGCDVSNHRINSVQNVTKTQKTLLIDNHIYGNVISMDTNGNVYIFKFPLDSTTNNFVKELLFESPCVKLQ